jgi:hypothetical protein
MDWMTERYQCPMSGDGPDGVIVTVQLRVACERRIEATCHCSPAGSRHTCASCGAVTQWERLVWTEHHNAQGPYTASRHPGECRRKGAR